MERLTRRTFGVLILALTTVVEPWAEGRQQPVNGTPFPRTEAKSRPPRSEHVGARAFGRTELFFGTLTPRGVVTDADFQWFVDEHVTARFPDGLTVLKGAGQFRGADQIITKESSFVLIVLYPYETRQESQRKLDEIREIYKDLYQQQSVMRVDDPAIVWVRF